MFESWDNYYLMIGSAAGALIGLLFVVVTLTGGLDRRQAMRGAQLYMTPTVFHFAMVLVVSAVTMVPRAPAWVLGLGLIAVALLGLVYSAWVGSQIVGGKAPDTPHWTDVWCYGAAPAVIYLALGAAAVRAFAAPTWASYGVALALMALLLVGIRNAWDLVTYLAPGGPVRVKEKEKAKAAPKG